jgi:hypothetical protein
MARFLAAALGAGAVTACSLVTSLDGYTGGATPTTGSEAGGLEAGRADAATQDGDAGLACPGASNVCLDFEEGDRGAWDDTNVTNGATATVEQGSLVVTVPTGSGGSAACFSKRLPDGVTRIDVDVDVVADALGSLDFDILGLRGSASHNLTLQIRAGKLELDEDTAPDGSTDEILTNTGFVFDAAWHHLRWTNQIAGGSATVEVFVDGVKRGTWTMDARDYATPTTFDLGDCVIVPLTTAWKIRFDNLVVVAK